MLAGMTHLLALASAPSLETTAVRHVEVLQLQPHVVLIVLIPAARGLARNRPINSATSSKWCSVPKSCSSA